MPATRFNKPGWANQMSGLRVTLLQAGAAINTNIALAGARANKDIIIAAVDVTAFAALELPSITSDGNIQFPTTATGAKKLLIFWDASN